ncbi:hypothetical protein ACP275_13G017800 [Erythranthe tilingii]
MSDPWAEEFVFNLRYMTSKYKSKVLFAEATSNFVDILLSFLTMPLGTIVSVLKEFYEKVSIGSLTSLYDGLSDLHNDHFLTEGCKKMLLNPRSSFDRVCSRLKHNVNDTRQPTEYFMCENWPCPDSRDLLNISMDYDIGRCKCGESLKKKIRLEEYAGKAHDDCDGDGVFTVINASFVVSDDLRVVPNVEGSVMETLKNLGITEMDGAEFDKTTFGLNEFMDLLKGSFSPRPPLTEVLIGERWMGLNREPRTLFHEMENETTSNFKKMILKVMVEKSTNKLLFAQSNGDFVDFLCSMLTIPLGGVERLLGGKTCLEYIDNLYRSLENINGDKYLKNPDTKSRLTNSKLPHGYMSPDGIIPSSDEIPPQLFYHYDVETGKKWLSGSIEDSGQACPTEFQKHNGYYVKRGITMYMVTDDLTITPLNMNSSFSVLDRLDIPLSDVEEVEVHVGLQECLSILKASLTSTCALSNGLRIIAKPKPPPPPPPPRPKPRPKGKPIYKKQRILPPILPEQREE